MLTYEQTCPLLILNWSQIDTKVHSCFMNEVKHKLKLHCDVQAVAYFLILVMLTCCSVSLTSYISFEDILSTPLSTSLYLSQNKNT